MVWTLIEENLLTLLIDLPELASQLSYLPQVTVSPVLTSLPICQNLLTTEP